MKSDAQRRANRKYKKTEKGKASEKRYKQSAKGKAAQKRADKKYNAETERHRPPGPASSAGPVGAAAQRARKARPEYRLARKLGISVKTAREMIEGGVSEG